MSSNLVDLTTQRDAQRAAFTTVIAANPTLGISGHKCSWVPGPFTAEDVDSYAPMFAQCVAWLRAFHRAAPGVNVESDLARDCLMSWRALHGDKEHVNLGVFQAAALHLGIAGARRRGRPDIYVELRLATVLLALDAWGSRDHDDAAHPMLDAVERALKAARA